MPITPADVIAGTLRRAGIPNPDVHAKTIAADLAGHALLADSPQPRRSKRNTEPPQRCRQHPGTAMENRLCPICGGTTAATTNPTTTNGD